jgi:hypothetical protein
VINMNATNASKNLFLMPGNQSSTSFEQFTGSQS